MSVAGVELLQPSTALAGLALFALLYSALARLWSARRSPLRQILDRHPLPHEEESRLQASPSCCMAVCAVAPLQMPPGRCLPLKL